MSDTPAERSLDALSAGIERDIAETRKLRYESDKLAEERNKMWHEARKLEAGHDKLRRDTGMAPWLIVIGIMGSLGGIIAGATAVARLAGWIS